MRITNNAVDADITSYQWKFYYPQKQQAPYTWTFLIHYPSPTARSSTMAKYPIQEYFYRSCPNSRFWHNSKIKFCIRNLIIICLSAV